MAHPGHRDVSLAHVNPWRAGVRHAFLPCVWRNLPRPAQALWLMVVGPWHGPARSTYLGTRFGGWGSSARSNDRVLIAAAGPDRPEDVVQRVSLDFEVQRALGDA